MDRQQEYHDPLTEREREILALIAEGLTNQQIADQLYLTLDTVKWYNRQTYQKLGVHRRTQAVAAARKIGLLDTPSSSARHNLPAKNTLFIGRKQELASIQARLMNPACRLLTLVGPGGIGKTCLAVEVAHQLIELFPDGVYFVPLVPVEFSTFVVQALAAALGLSPTSQRDPMDQVINFLRRKTLLLVIDNFEHLLDGVSLLGKLLAESKAVTLLVTSRERLRLKDEWVFDVQGLPYPVEESEDQTHVTHVDYEAGQLFLQTAQRVVSDFRPDESDQTHITHICRLVGGLPLGIELAATWVRLLPCAEIAHKLTQDLDILTTAWRDVPERHRSIQAVLDHSWTLLAADEQDAFCRLTVFSGRFGHETAAAVVNISLTMLLALVDKSFLRQVDDERFEIHELMKQYGRDKLRANPELWTAARLQHCRHYAALLNERMSASDASSHLNEIEQMFDDLQAAWRFAVGNQQLAEIQQLAAGFLVYYRRHSWYRAGPDALTLYQQALACFDPNTVDCDHRAAIACLHESLGDLQALATAHKDALAAYEQAFGNAAETDYVRRGRLYGKIADVWVAMNRHGQGDTAYRLAESVLESAPQRDTSWWVEWFRIKTQRLELFYWQNRPDDMASIVSEIQPLIEQHGSVTQQLRYLYLLGMMALRRDNYFCSEDAIVYTDKALALSLKTGNLGEIAYRYFSHGFSHLWSNHLDEAETNLQIAREMTEENGDLTLLSRTLAYITVIYRKRGNIEHVQEYAAYGLRIAGKAKMPQYTGMARAQYAWLAWRAGDLAETIRQAQAAISDWGGLGSTKDNVPFYWFALFPLLGVALQDGEIAQSAEYAQRMLMSPQQRLPDNLTDLLERAVATWTSGQPDTTSDLLCQAFQLAQRLDYV
jgi:predicted ATPase/DNA-binding CsgD family transcriptional regulator